MRRNLGAASDADVLAQVLREISAGQARSRRAARSPLRAVRIGSWTVREQDGELVAVCDDGRRRALTMEGGS